MVAYLYIFIMSIIFIQQKIKSMYLFNLNKNRQFYQLTSQIYFKMPLSLEYLE